MRRNKGFHLDKWYIDAIREDGSGVILYDASLRWKFLRLHYYNRLEFDAFGQSKNAVALRRKLLIDQDATSLRASDGRIDGHWEARTPGYSVDLLVTENGSIRWGCHYPNCTVNLKEGAMEQRAQGYAEQLIMTLDPWKFNIDELYWGRFCSPDHSIVWIEWRGAIARKWLFENGKRIEDFQLTDDGITCSAFKLDLSNKHMLRTGTLLSTVFKSFRWLRFLFPGKTIFSDETKWCARGVLTSNDTLVKGFSIFEKVLWVK